MAETKTEAKSEARKPGPASADAKADLALAEGGKAGEAGVRPSPASDGGPNMLMRALMGFSGLSLLVGFFLPWVRIPERPGDGEGAAAIAAHMASGLDLLSEAGIGGAPAALLLVVPILGTLLSAAAFMGFRWAGHVAIGVAASLLLFGLWVVLRLFVEHTDLGLWVTVGGTFITLLLGVITILWTRDRKGKAAAPRNPPPDAAPSKT